MRFFTRPLLLPTIFYGTVLLLLVTLFAAQNHVYRTFTGDHLESARRALILSALQDPISTGNSLELRQRISDLEKSLSISCIEIQANGDPIHSCSIPPDSGLETDQFVISNPYGGASSNEFIVKLYFSDYFFEKKFKVIFLTSLLLLLIGLITSWIMFLKVARNATSIDRESNELKRLYRILHDIKSPLSSIGISIDRQSELTEERTDLVRRSYESLKVLTEQGLKIKNLKNISNFLGKQTKLIDIERIVDEAVKLLMPQANSNKNIVDVNVKGKIDANKYILLAPQTFQRIVTNLLKNSLEAGKNMDIELLLGFGIDSLVISVSDMGSGFSQKHLEMAGNTEFTTKNLGDGIGLSFVKEATSNGLGSFKIFSEERKGTLIQIEFPHFSEKIAPGPTELPQ